MHPNGIVRRIDDLGRVIIPKEIRHRLKIGIGDVVEVFMDNGTIVIRKYEPVNDIHNEMED